MTHDQKQRLIKAIERIAMEAADYKMREHEASAHDDSGYAHASPLELDAAVRELREAMEPL